MARPNVRVTPHKAPHPAPLSAPAPHPAAAPGPVHDVAAAPAAQPAAAPTTAPSITSCGSCFRMDAPDTCWDAASNCCAAAASHCCRAGDFCWLLGPAEPVRRHDWPSVAETDAIRDQQQVTSTAEELPKLDEQQSPPRTTCQSPSHARTHWFCISSLSQLK